MPTPTTGDLGPAILNLIGVRGGDKNEMIVNITKDSTPLDLTGMTLTAQARAKDTDIGDAPLNAVVYILGDPTEGRINLRWPGVDVTTVLNGKSIWKGVWDLQQVTPEEDPVTLLAGTFEATQDVTR